MDDDFLDEMRMDANELQVKAESEEPVIPSAPLPKTIDEIIEEIFEDKPKMVSLSYSGFEIPGSHLCVIVEPYPPLPKEALRAKTPGSISCSACGSSVKADYYHTKSSSSLRQGWKRGTSSEVQVRDSSLPSRR